MLLVRAARLQCPNCGGGSLFGSWFRIKDCCPTCGLRTGRGEEGYLVGAYMFNIMASELLWAALCIGLTLATWPDPPGALMIVLPILGYPFARTFFLAFDLIFRPSRDTEPAP
jgi:uncharacterized protein (DUF983 family)